MDNEATNMRITHTTKTHARCPENDGWDYYDVTIELSEEIALATAQDVTVELVENIERVIESLRGKKLYQEDITQSLAQALRAKVTTCGRHGSFETVVVSALP